MAQRSKFFRVAVEGATTDGRNIERSWLTEMAATYDRSVYGARVWIEHMRGMLPDSIFKAVGDVLALKAEEIAEGPLKGKMALYAQIEPLPDLVAFTTKLKQKIFSSMEVVPKFADTGRAYFTGLGVTDSPASLGTDVLAFAAKNPDASPFKTRHSHEGALFSAAEEVLIEFEDVADHDAGAKKFSDTLKDILSRFTKKGQADDSRFSEVASALETFGAHVAERDAALQKTADNVVSLSRQVGELTAVVRGMKGMVDKIDLTEDKTTRRPPATGGDGQQQTDC